MAGKAGRVGSGVGREERKERRRGGSRHAAFPEGGEGPAKRGDPPIEERHGPRSRHGNVDSSRDAGAGARVGDDA
jgi:hypothetical protein